MPALTPGGVITRRRPSAPFEVHLDVFSGPFDLLLGLISKHKLDITEVALAKVTDEFVAHIKAAQAADSDWDLGQASEFLLIAATLLDLKAARLLPSAGPRTTRTSPSSRRATCSSPGCCSTAPTRRSRRPSASGWPRPAASAAPGRSRARVRRLLPELVIGLTPEQFARSRRGR